MCISKTSVEFIVEDLSISIPLRRSERGRIRSIPHGLNRIIVSFALIQAFRAWPQYINILSLFPWY